MPVGLGRIVSSPSVDPIPLLLGSRTFGPAAWDYWHSLMTNRGGTWTTTYYEQQLPSGAGRDMFFSYGAARVGDIVFGATTAESGNPTPHSTIRIGKRSTDKGVTWSDVIIPNFNTGTGSGAASRWFQVAARPDGLMVAVGGNAGSQNTNSAPLSVIYYSSDFGETWTRTTSITAPSGMTNNGLRPITGVIYAEKLGAFFATMQDGFYNSTAGNSTAILKSTDGINWSVAYVKVWDPNGQGGNFYTLNGIGWNGETLLAFGLESVIAPSGVGISNYYLSATSTDGDNWILNRGSLIGFTSAGSNWSKIVGNKDGIWIAAANGVHGTFGNGTLKGRNSFWRSADNGATWTQLSTSSGVWDLAATKRRFYRCRASAYFDLSTPVVSSTVQSSSDGATWATDTSPIDNGYRPTAFASFVKKAG